LLKSVIKEKYFDKYKNKKRKPTSVLRWEFASVYKIWREKSEILDFQVKIGIFK